MFPRSLQRLLSGVLCITVFAASVPVLAAQGRPTRMIDDPVNHASDAAPAAEDPSDHRLRDAIPMVSFASAPPDTASDDDFFLPEETDNKKLIRDITVFVIVTAFVAYFIIKVFIEEDEEEAPEQPNGKPITPPR